jgi:hypothetical protein
MTAEAGRGVFDVRDYGARGIAVPARVEKLEILDHVDWHYPPGIAMPVYDRDDESAVLDSVGIQAAVDAAHAAGGGTVRVPPGHYLLDSIELKSFVTLRLDNGAFLYGSPRLEDYLNDMPDGPVTLFDRVSGSGLPESRPRIKKLIWAWNARKAAITGPGVVDAQGHAFIIPWLNSSRTLDHALRPREMFALVGCRDLSLTDFTIRNSSWWTLAIQGCMDAHIRHLTIRNFDGPQVDGIDLVDSQNVTISDCHIHAADDAICFKNNRPDQALRNITVSNCVIRTLCNAVKIGTNSSGLFENIVFSDLIVHNPPGDTREAEAAICVSSVDGGMIRQVRFDGIQARGARCPFYLVGGNRRANQPEGLARPGRLEDVVISNSAFIGGVETALIVAHPDAPFRRIDIRHVNLIHAAEKRSAARSPFAYDPETYPRPTMYGRPPASVLYARGAPDLEVHGCRFAGPQEDDRPSFRADEPKAVKGRRSCSDAGRRISSSADCRG